ncbi:LacI family DNA-binding transcriptional regulator [Salipiger sp. 1_MG-2023]|uniref:LacI family DNA-binding transcriptional regulator n=1 Tax=Salipiger sp. 1_MG-2023 TaxID=3062665 RepID=UPI0026E332CB|nr:LacI family DNA-binding transcriptional regulator [Salipiger sp. 1_MG-2023]MDO6588305.1 LacI family DNA-binding transcriptional regulator [Salipiger sp. 1_MG-2023]
MTIRKKIDQRANVLDVARHAGVSTATVSRTLSHPEKVSPATRARVMASVKEIGYRPNLAAQAFRSRVTRTVIVLVPDIGNAFYPDIIRAMEDTANKQGFTVLLANTDMLKDKEQSYHEMLRDGRADGMVLMTGRLPQGYSPEDNLPMIAISEEIPGTALPLVAIDNVAGAAAAVSHLHAAGHQRIGHITGPQNRIFSYQRLSGYRRGLEQAGLPYAPSLVASGDFTFEGGLAGAQTLLDLPAPPTAIFCANDESAAGAMLGARKKGLSIPKDLSIMGFDNLTVGRMLHPTLTTLHQPRTEMGHIGMSLILQLIQGTPPSKSFYELPFKVIERESVGPPRVE